MSIAELRKRIDQFMEVRGRYGIAAEEGRQAKDSVRRRNGQREFFVDQGKNVATVAAINEFGGGTVPKRDAFRRSYTVRDGELKDAIQGSVKKLVRGISGNDAMQQIATAGGKIVVDNIATTTGWADPNSPKWIRIKGQGHPLIATGQEVDSISGEVVKGDARVSKKAVTPEVSGG